MGQDDMGLVGYARVSSVGQSLDVQREKLQDCDKIFLLEHGRLIASGTYEELNQKSPQFRSMVQLPEQ